MTKKLYVVDDDVQYSELLVEVAQGAGWIAEAEQIPSQFLEREIEDGSLLVLDLIMPDMDGVEVIRALAKKNANVALILISGFDTRVLHSAQQLAEAHRMSVKASLTKPFALSDFVAILERIQQEVVEQPIAREGQRPPAVNELRDAIREHQLVTYFQPQIDMKTGRLHGAEVLTRWQHPERGLVFPDQFIALAEAHGLMGQLTTEVVNLSVAQAQQWNAQGVEIPLSINLSADNVLSLELPERLKALVDENHIKPSHITLELTETAVMGKLTSSLDVLNRLRMKGFALSIDDFGTGYSSFSHLYQAPFTELKIDQRFIRRMLSDSEAMAIVKICIMLGSMLGMLVVAEGVENQEIWGELQHLGCDIAQGYYIAKPMAAEDFEQWRLGWQGTQTMKEHQ